MHELDEKLLILGNLPVFTEKYSKFFVVNLICKNQRTARLPIFLQWPYFALQNCLKLQTNVFQTRDKKQKLSIFCLLTSPISSICLQDCIDCTGKLTDGTVLLRSI